MNCNIFKSSPFIGYWLWRMYPSILMWSLSFLNESDSFLVFNNIAMKYLYWIVNIVSSFGENLRPTD